MTINSPLPIPKTVSRDDLAREWGCGVGAIKKACQSIGIGFKIGKAFRIPVDDIPTLMEAMKCPSKSSAVKAPRSGGSRARSMVSATEKALALATERKPKKSGQYERPKSGEVLAFHQQNR